LEKRFLIVCEDGKSSPNYFRALQKYLKLSATSIEVAGSNGRSQPIQVVSRALELKKEAAKPTSGTVPFDQVWCVIDGDYGAKIANARARAKANQVRLAVTTKCFEYWVLLHFEANDKSTPDCNGIVRSLKSKHLPEYEKGTCDFKDIVHRVVEACQRAENVRKPGITRDELPENLFCFARKWRDAPPEVYYDSAGVSPCESLERTIRLSRRWPSFAAI